MKKIIINTDGGARGNPGPAGIGFTIKNDDGSILAEGYEYIGEKTNNFAEYEAVFLALKKAKSLMGSKTREISFEIKLDSELVKKQLSGEYQIKEESLFPQFIKIWNLKVKDFPNIFFSHIAREENKEADELANMAMDKGEAKGLF